MAREGIAAVYRLLAPLVLTLGAHAQTAKEPPPPPEQPIPFSHKAHAGTLKLECKMCHPNPDPGDEMTIARPSVCMSCHSKTKTDSSHIQRLANYARNGAQLPWVRVYEVPPYVSFNHRVHVENETACEDCHGPVAERDKLAREGDIRMAACMKCHQAKQVSVDCKLCHEPR